MASKNNLQAFSVLEPEKKEPETQEQTQQKGKFDSRLITFCITNFVINVGVSQIAPFYPDLAANEAGLNYTQIGMVFAINPLGSIFMSLLIGSMMAVWGRKRCLIVALVLQSVVQVLFGCLNYMTDNKSLFLGMSMTTRVFQGSSRAIYSSVTFAYVPIFWPNEFQKKLGIMETMTALGLLFGPVIGSLLNGLFGFSVPFYLIATFFILSIIPITLLIPQDSEMKTFQKRKKLPIGKAFTSVKVVVTILNIMTITTGYIFFNPFFVNHMAAYGINSNIAAIVLTIPSLFYIINVNIVPKLQKKCQKTFLMSLSLLLCFIGNMIEAPFYGNSKTIFPIIIGLMLVGVAQAYSMLPSIPQLIDFLTPVINDPTLKAGISDMSASLFIMAMGLGSLIGPLLGGSVYDKFGGNVDPREFPEQEKTAFRHSLEILGTMQLIVGILFFFFADGYKGWQDMLRRCSSKGEQSQPLNQPFINASSNESDGVLSDNDSSPDTDLPDQKEIPQKIRITRSAA